MTVQTEQGIFDAINAQLQTLPNIADIQVIYLGVAGQPEAETPYLSTAMPAFSAIMLTVGSIGILQWKGIYQVSVNFPLGNGTESVTGWMTPIRQLFPIGLTLPTAEGWGVKFLAPTPRGIIPDGAYLRGIVHCPWLLHEYVTGDV